MRLMERLKDYQPRPEPSVALPHSVNGRRQPTGDDDPDDLSGMDGTAELPTNLPAGGDFDADLSCPYHHMAADVQPQEAPSGAAWFLREHGSAAKTAVSN